MQTQITCWPLSKALLKIRLDRTLKAELIPELQRRWDELAEEASKKIGRIVLLDERYRLRVLKFIRDVLVLKYGGLTHENAKQFELDLMYYNDRSNFVFLLVRLLQQIIRGWPVWQETLERLDT